ncbi:hypothetical protein [Acinetobacter pittii]|uniref:Uncharacterized protein n=1 Tax=Acinetobacter pittii TaxID=48296 RepID=A0A6H0FSF4_ACIPI|nr:hypothetical protein [Acinetobacter pittii]QIT17297.1 hypothetical protein G8E09_05980 [Acinetobacter pittii]
MGTGIYIQGGRHVSIKDVTSNNCSTAVHIVDADELEVNGLYTKECHKGLQLDNCWDAALTNLDIQTKNNDGNFKEKLLSCLIRSLINEKF